MGLQIIPRLQAYLEPLLFLAIAAYGAIFVFIEIVTFRRRPKDALSKTALSDRIFSKVWLRLNTTIATNELSTVLPSLVAKATGTVLEIGPGSGNQLSRYDRSKVERIYGVEPNVDLHAALQVTIKECGLSDVYTIIPCGVEDVEGLRKYGVERESVDTVLSVQVLCGVPRPEVVVKELYRYLKPGGQMIVYEHVRSDDFVSRTVQRIYNIIWPFAMGNCHLGRPIGQYLLEAGSWGTIELETPKDEDAWLIFPRVTGRLVKWGA